MVSVQQKDLLEEDLKVVYTELLEEAGLSLAEEQKNFYDYLHFSPIKVTYLGHWAEELLRLPALLPNKGKLFLVEEQKNLI